MKGKRIVRMSASRIQVEVVAIRRVQLIFFGISLSFMSVWDIRNKAETRHEIRGSYHEEGRVLRAKGVTECDNQVLL